MADTITMVKDGQAADVPIGQFSVALSQGAKPAVLMQGPDGSQAWIPHDQLGPAMKQGAKIIQQAQDQSQPTQFEQQRSQRQGFLGPFVKSLAQFPAGLADTLGQAMKGNAVGAAATLGGQIGTEDVQRQNEGRSLPYRTVAAAGTALGVPARGMEEAANRGDTAAVAGQATGTTAALVGVPLAAKGIGAISSKVANVIPGVDEMIGTTPSRIAEISQLPAKVEGVRQTVIAAEKAAHEAASNSFPTFDKPIETGKMIEKPAVGPTNIDDFGEQPARGLVPETTTFKDLQEQRSNLLADIATEKRAVSRGATPRFDLADMYQKLSTLDETMNKAALDQGGPQGLAQLESARQKFSQYMQDFHNTGSPLRSILESQPGQTNKVVGQLLNADNGPRSLETLRRYGIDTSPIESLLNQGKQPLRVTTAEAAKLRSAGGVDNYINQRLRESIAQATTNQFPGSAEARLPASVMRNRWPSVISEIPGANIVSPRKLAALRLQQALKSRVGK